MKYLFVTFIFLGFNALGQNVLFLTEAKQMAIENNYNSQISQQNIKLVENNMALIKVGRKPTFNLNAGVNGNLNNSIVKAFQAPEQIETWAAPSLKSNVSISTNYLLWDAHRIDSKLKQNEAAQTEVRLGADIIKENILFQVENIYINILLLQERQFLLKESLDISNKRKQRAQYAFDYGQANKINLLNATVDLNRDSLDIIKFDQQVINLKRNLNLLLNRDINIEYDLDENLMMVKNTKTLPQYKEIALDNNLDILKAKAAINVTSFDKDINNSNLKPQVFANASYGVNYQKNSDANLIDYGINDGLNVGVVVAWNIGDGGRTKYLNENAQIRLSTQQIIYNQIHDQVINSLTNTFGDYQNAIKLLGLEGSNVKSAQENYTYSETLFQQGQINSISFRQAQLNLLSAKLNEAKAKYEVALYELDLKQLSGVLE